MPLTQASLSICSSTACQPSTIKLPVHFRPNHAERKSLNREAASCEGWGVTAGLFVFIFWRIMKSGMHACSPDLPHSKLLSKHPPPPRFALIRLTGSLRRRGRKQHLSNDSAGVDSFLCGSILYKALGHRCYYPLYS